MQQLMGNDCTSEKDRVVGCIGGFTKGIYAVYEYNCVFSGYLPPVSLRQEHNQECFLTETHTSTNTTLNISAAEDSRSDNTSVLMIVFITLGLGAVMRGSLFSNLLIFIKI